METEQLIAASQAWSTAYYAGDVQTLESFEYPDLIVIDNRNIWKKSKRRPSTTTGSIPYMKRVSAVRFRENSGIVVGTMEKPDDLLSLMMFSEFWKKEQGQWKIMAAHFASISPFES